MNDINPGVDAPRITDCDGPPCPICASPLRSTLLSVRGPLVVAYRCDEHGLMSYGLPFNT